MANQATGFPAYRLAQFAEKLGRPCDGAFMIQWWKAHGKITTEAWIAPALSKLWLAGNCEQVAGKGKTTIAVPANAPVVKTQVKVDGVTGTFLVDLHAGTSAVTKTFAAKAKLNALSQQSVASLEGGTVHHGPYTLARAVQVGGAQVEDANLLVLDDLPPGIDGVLGLSVLMRFEVQVTPKGVVLGPLPK